MGLRSWVLVFVVSVLAGSGAGPSPSSAVPSEAEAVALLRQMWAAVEARDLAGLCDDENGPYVTGPCNKELRDLDPATIPTTPPTVVGAWVLPTRRVSDGLWWVGGRVLEVCGVDGRGTPYRSEMRVSREFGRLLAGPAVFWTGTRIATGDTAGAAIPGPSVPPCPSEPAPPTKAP